MAPYASAVQELLGGLLREWRGDPEALDCLWVSVFAIGNELDCVVPPMPLTQVGAIRLEFAAMNGKLMPHLSHLITQILPREHRRYHPYRELMPYVDRKPCLALLTAMPEEPYLRDLHTTEFCEAFVSICDTARDESQPPIKRICSFYGVAEELESGAPKDLLQWGEWRD